MLSRARTAIQRSHGGLALRDGDATLEFARWFRKSKIVDEAGAPKIVYHGTTRAFDFFEARKRNPELGFHFGSLSQAEWFACFDERGTSSGGNIRPVYLRLENPLRMPDIFERGRCSSENAADWLARQGLISKTDASRIHCARSAREAHAHIACSIERVGYDGIVYENELEGGTSDINADSYVVFRPEQIKSAFEVAVRRRSLDQ